MRYLVHGCAISLVVLCIGHGSAWAHGFAGQRFFPEPLVMEDPFPADAMTLPGISYRRGADERELSLGAELEKRITPAIGVGAEVEFIWINPLDPAEPNLRGYGNPEFFIKWMPVLNAEREAMVGLSLALESSIGNGNVSEHHAALHPQLAFSKGLGDLPDSWGWLRPLAVQGAAGLEFPIGATDPEGTVLTYHLLIEYSLQYLQAFVKDIGLPRPLSRLFPIVEFGFQTPLSGDEKGRTEAFAYPGLIWAGKRIEVGAGAQIPLTNEAGSGVGIVGLVQFYLDDLFHLQPIVP
ncbi:MAG: hypothetical protein AB1515_10440 [Nitrospirota bacterium]